MARVIEAEAIISARDRTGRTFAQVANKMRIMNRASKIMNASLMSSMALMARYAGPAALGALTAAAERRSRQVERALTRIGITADATREEMVKAREVISAVAFDTAQSFDVVQGGVDSLTASGKSLAEALALLPSVAKTAQASGAPVTDMANTAVALEEHLAIAADKMQIAFDILAKGGKAGKFELEDQARYLAELAPAYAKLGNKGTDGLKQLVAMLQTIRQYTGSAGEAATAARNIFAKMESEATAKTFKKFGVNLRKEMAIARKEGKDLLEVFLDLSDQALKGDLSKLPQLFTDMQFQQGMLAMLKGRDAFKGFLAEMEGAAGTVDKDFNRVLDDAQAKWDRMSTAVDGLAQTIAGDLMANTAEWVDWLGKGIKVLDESIKNRNMPDTEDRLLALQKRAAEADTVETALRSRARYEKDPIKRQKLIDQADRVRFTGESARAVVGAHAARDMDTVAALAHESGARKWSDNAKARMTEVRATAQLRDNMEMLRDLERGRAEWQAGLAEKVPSWVAEFQLKAIDQRIAGLVEANARLIEQAGERYVQALEGPRLSPFAGARAAAGLQGYGDIPTPKRKPPAPSAVKALVERELSAGAGAVLPSPTIDRDGLKEDMDRIEADVDAFMRRLKAKTEVTLSPTIRPNIAAPRTGPGSVGVSMPEVEGVP